ncbi:MAG: hypothetical protein M0005_18260 [Actinomycetota bacterium]|nr:hypothetical protein [Actinomycetota bacterium]
MSGTGRWLAPLLRTTVWALLAALVLAGVLVVPSPRPAAAVAPAPRLTLRAREAQGQSPEVDLVARLASPSGPSAAARRALGGVTVTFAIHLDEFAGAPLLTLGSATTNAAGEASLAYAPTFSGRQALVATATDAAGATVATATTTYLATAATHPLAGRAEAARPDGMIGRVVVAVLLALVALLWVILVAVVVRVQRRPGASLP